MKTKYDSAITSLYAMVVILVALLIYAFINVYGDYKKDGNDIEEDGISGFIRKVWFE